MPIRVRLVLTEPKARDAPKRREPDAAAEVRLVVLESKPAAERPRFMAEVKLPGK